ncbi:MAG: helix-turn-helix transcriptional regulator, partial [Mycobacterium sp.]|nr:helix-turn-helix transcriptional regulator [Mycobacterium sp.]
SGPAGLGHPRSDPALAHRRPPGPGRPDRRRDRHLRRRRTPALHRAARGVPRPHRVLPVAAAHREHRVTARASNPITPGLQRRRRGPGGRADADHPTRHELLDAAIGLAEREGLAGLSVARITAAAGHAKGTFYVHFPDRAAFMVALHRRFHDALFSRIVAATAAEPLGPARAGKRLSAFLEGCRALPGVRAVLLEVRTEPAVATEVDRRNRQAAAVLAADLAECCAQPRETARLLVLAAADVAARESDRRRRLPAARRALLDLVPSGDPR